MITHALDVGMKSFSLDFYGGMLWANNDYRDTITSISNPIEFNQLQYDEDDFIVGPPRPVAFNLFDIFKIPYTGRNLITGWVGQISSFGLTPPDSTTKEPAMSGPDVDVWLSKQPCGKMANDVFAGLKTGDVGAGSAEISGLALLLPATIYLNYWAHNMRRPMNSLKTHDWHCGFIIYYQ
ncbi:MAG TPA: hypothetical protein VK503_03055 [Candidatus Bathyarchaeia archaeon]|nr:hypothetical protein [Candidatus Bathyarchaeia archaeon]